MERMIPAPCAPEHPAHHQVEDACTWIISEAVAGFKRFESSLEGWSPNHLLTRRTFRAIFVQVSVQVQQRLKPLRTDTDVILLFLAEHEELGAKTNSSGNTETDTLGEVHF